MKSASSPVRVSMLYILGTLFCGLCLQNNNNNNNNIGPVVMSFSPSSSSSSSFSRRRRISPASSSWSSTSSSTSSSSSSSTTLLFMVKNNNNPFEALFQKKTNQEEKAAAAAAAAATPTTTTVRRTVPIPPPPRARRPDILTKEEDATTTTDNNKKSISKSNNKFDFGQRIESIKCAVIGAISGSIAIAPVALLHYAATSLPQWELTTDLAAIQGALFAIVYRYASRKDDDNGMLDQGIVGAFVLVRTLPSIQASPTDCSAFPLNCGPPIGYFNWNMLLNQAMVQGIESAVLFGGVYLALEYALDKGWISKFE